MIEYKPLPDRKQLACRKLEPPKEVKYRMMEKDRARREPNKLVSFVKIFFLGDGY
jgi:hypothetical protein